MTYRFEMNRETEIENALIASTTLGVEDHDIMTCWLGIEFDSGGCGFGGYAFDKYDRETKQRIGCAFGITSIRKILETVGVSKWEDLKGQHIRVEHEGIGGTITKIGHFMKNKWFSFKEEAEKYEKHK